MRKHLTESDSNNFTSNIMYYKFESGQGDCKDVPFDSEVRDELENHPNLRNISDKIAKALCDKIYSNLSTTPQFKRIIRILYQELNKTDYFTICQPVKHWIDKNNFDKNKVLFDYSKDYGNIEIDVAHGDTTCNQNYKGYIEKYIEIYNDAYSYCKIKNDAIYECDKFSAILNDVLYNKLSSFTCTQSENAIKALEEKEVLEEHENEKYGIYHNFHTHILRDSPEHSSVPRGVPVLHTKHSSEVQQDPEKIDSLLIGDGVQDTSSKTITGSIAPVLGVSSFSLLLYKVTENRIEIHIIMIYTYFHYS
ncbi:Plasmodium vivax Vir protein, putative [Plasmodium vivax]|uniref:Vir protein, putative n=1 Tax=Plasmodium vivax TaxID=5855 RepID=A0A1G4E6L4_PLAVI|nr:Plasmodium vivax Vir protein, putative [Plasmodium vivax]